MINTQWQHCISSKQVITALLLSGLLPTCLLLNSHAAAETHQIQGSLKAQQQVDLASQLTATLKSIKVKAGDTVKSGQLIALLDCADFRLQEEASQAELEAANVRLKYAKKSYTRQLQLYKKRTIPQSMLEQSEASYFTSAAELKMIRSKLALNSRQRSKCKISAPFTGVVRKKHASIGQLLSPGSPIASIANTQARQLVADVPANLIASLQQADSINVLHQQQRYSTTLLTVESISDPATGMQKAYLDSSALQAVPLNATVRIQWD